MSQKELSKVYEPHTVEDHWIQKWIDQGSFSVKSNLKTSAPYSIVIPPPNVTGSLHMGHALNTTIQDILIRYHRMLGDATIWVVGTDHAGIATQNVVERQLKEEGKTRFDLGRENFVKRVWKWREESGGTIINQLKRLGASCDYVNERFTMDEGLSKAVRKVFVQLYHDGLIARKQRLINWCPRCHTALSDLEVEHSEQKGHLWHIQYPLSENGKPSSNHFVTIATTRPETMLGDTAVAVHPDDQRYQALIGKKVILPLKNQEIPIIADAYVDKGFGSGVVKITPAHDFNDFEIGERHHLDRINILTHDGLINENGQGYAKLSVQKAREQIVADLEKQGLLKEVEDYKNSVGHCYRCKAVVEPYLSRQWFVKTKSLAENAMKAVQDGQTRFVPKHWEKTYFNWMENIQDWCISRQIWWGHQIPAWYCENTVARRSSLVASKEKNSNQPQTGATSDCPPIVSETTPDKCPHCGSKNLTQDEDVLDTWFSSALWPFSTLGWPENTPELKTFYPTSVLVTAFDIIFFWVARMMMMGLYFMKEVPFKDVHIHAIVRDPLGQKMSKSKGNVVDPLLVMKKYGTDAFRFTLTAFAAQGRDIKLDEARIEGYRNFCNKIWNASRFALMSASPFIQSEQDFTSIKPQNRINQWIVTELNKTIEKTCQGIQKYEFNRSAHALYKFFWQDFCSWYLELSKEIYRESRDEEKRETAQTTYYVLDNSLKLLHPFMPFITEEIWQMLANRQGKSIVNAPYPKTSTDLSSYESAWEEIELLTEMISCIRTIRQETGVPLTQEVEVLIQTSLKTQKLLKDIEPMLLKMAKVKKIQFISEDPREPSALAKNRDSLIAIPFKDIIDKAKELERQNKKLKNIQKDIMVLTTQLQSQNFIENAPQELIEEKKKLLEEAQDQISLIEKAIQLIQ